MKEIMGLNYKWKDSEPTHAHIYLWPEISAILNSFEKLQHE